MRLTFRQTHLYRFVNMAQKEGFEPTQKIYISIAALVYTVFRVQIRVQF